MRFTLVIALIIVVFVALFALQNSQVVQIGIFLWRFEGPLVIVLLVTFVVGILSGWLAAIPSSWKKSRQVAELRRRECDAQRSAPRKSLIIPAPAITSYAARNANMPSDQILSACRQGHAAVVSSDSGRRAESGEIS